MPLFIKPLIKQQVRFIWGVLNRNNQKVYEFKIIIILDLIEILYINYIIKYFKNQWISSNKEIYYKFNIVISRRQVDGLG